LFEDKAALITAAMDEDLLELTRQLRFAAGTHDTPLERIRAMGRAYVQFGLSHPAEYAFVFMQQRPHVPPEIARVRHGDPGEDPYALARTLWAELAATGAVSDAEDDVDLMTQIFWEGKHGLTSRQLVMGADDEWLPVIAMDRHVETMIDVLLTGILACFKPKAR
jgi:AcrR family transcriptional regulator